MLKESVVGGKFILLNEIILPTTEFQILASSRPDQDTMHARVRGRLVTGPDGPGSTQLLSFIGPLNGSGGQNTSLIYSFQHRIFIES